VRFATRYARAVNEYETSSRLGRLLLENGLEEDAMKRTLLAAVILLGAAGFAVAQTMPLMSLPPPGKTVTRFYKQNVYDPAKDKIGTVDDVIVNDRGQISGLIIGVGGFLV
jgi:hypothetical protein